MKLNLFFGNKLLKLLFFIFVIISTCNAEKMIINDDFSSDGSWAKEGGGSIGISPSEKHVSFYISNLQVTDDYLCLLYNPIILNGNFKLTFDMFIEHKEMVASSANIDVGIADDISAQYAENSVFGTRYRFMKSKNYFLIRTFQGSGMYMANPYLSAKIVGELNNEKIDSTQCYGMSDGAWYSYELEKIGENCKLSVYSNNKLMQSVSGSIKGSNAPYKYLFIGNIFEMGTGTSGIIDNLKLISLSDDQDATVVLSKIALNSIKPDLSSPQTEGAKIIWMADANNPHGDTLFYRFKLLGARTGYKWTDMTGWTPSNTWTWGTSTDDVGAKNQILVEIRKENYQDPEKYDDSKVSDYYVIESNPAKQGTSNTPKVTTTEPTTGQTTSEGNEPPVAHINIQHPRPSDLHVYVGVMSPQGDILTEKIVGDGGKKGHDLKLDVKLDGFEKYWPTASSTSLNKWYLKVIDDVTSDEGSIRAFSIEYKGQIEKATTLPNIEDFREDYAWIDNTPSIPSGQTSGTTGIKSPTFLYKPPLIKDVAVGPDSSYFVLEMPSYDSGVLGASLKELKIQTLDGSKFKYFKPIFDQKSHDERFWDGLSSVIFTGAGAIIGTIYAPIGALIAISDVINAGDKAIGDLNHEPIVDEVDINFFNPSKSTNLGDTSNFKIPRFLIQLSNSQSPEINKVSVSETFEYLIPQGEMSQGTKTQEAPGEIKDTTAEITKDETFYFRYYKGD